MTIGRRAFLAAGPLLVASASIPRAWSEGADGTAGDLRMTPRVIGSPDAKITVHEWFSLTCTHCAHFSETIFPAVKTKLIDTGKIRYRFHDFPLDQLALLAAMVARSLPVERYESFVSSLFSSQMQWAFSQGVDPVAELRKHAALAGINSAEFDRINADDAFREAIVNKQDRDGAFLQINSTPHFRINETPAPDASLSYDDFAKAVAKAS